ncbi:DUF2306 domain-containing protein [Aliikangiella coralliicola]|uniref:DUF2306 domain-containing protein n=1 Tax=Aliikangiella coralliicola TaxID=2592383 RepID=A0A545U4E2_9GAMM|nr:DUF2306 domain-containing protein [Aliikangiella coralliicola]TQV84338.1 DUF2306 domain-containing protein [Aliikangiella coralliicola]
MTDSITTPSVIETADRNVVAQKLKINALSNKALKSAAQLCFLVTVIGQWIFAYYVISFYGTTAIEGDFEAWNKVLPKGHIPGDTIGNFAVGMHILLAIIILVGGPLQLIPQIRTHLPTFHHWNGRIYITTTILLSIGGLFMVWTRGTLGGGQVAISINALLIILCALLALFFAIKRNIKVHRRWALRLFFVAVGVWYFRIGLMLWLLIHGEPVGFDPKTFEGPFLDFLSYAQYILPLIMLELYFYAKERAGNLGQLTVALSLFIVTIATGAGVFAATMGLWLPRI